MKKLTHLNQVDSLEPLILMSGSTIDGTSDGEWISGTAADDAINAGGGDDEIHAPLGNNLIDGGNGVDKLVIYEGNQSDYEIFANSDGSVSVVGPGQDGVQQTNTIRNIEMLVFNDGWVNVEDVVTVPDNPNAPDSGPDTPDDDDDDTDPSGSDKSGSNKSGSNKSGSDMSESNRSH